MTAQASEADHGESLLKLASPGLITESLFFERAWQSAQTLLASAILGVGTCTVASCLRVMNFAGCSRFQRFHRVLNRAKRSPSKQASVYG